MPRPRLAAYLFSLSSFLLSMACTSAKVATTMQTVTTGSYSMSEERGAVLVKSEAEYREQWQKRIGEGEAPAVDFDANVVVFLLGGMHNTGGWRVVPESVQIDGDTAVITAKVQGPPPGGITTQAITYPYAIVSIDQRNIEKVRWD